MEKSFHQIDVLELGRKVLRLGRPAGSAQTRTERGLRCDTGRWCDGV